MKKRILLSWLLVSVSMLTGCSKIIHFTKSPKVTASNTAEILLNEERYALVLPSESDAYDDKVAEGYSEIMEIAGRDFVVERPEHSTTSSQQKIIEQLTDEHISCIAISPNDAEALTDELKAAMEQGIDVCTFDQPGNPEARELYINPSGCEETAETMLDAVLDLSGGAGQWAILSVSAVSDSQGGWIDSIKVRMNDEAYRDLDLLEIAYGNDMEQTSYDQTRALLMNYQDLRVICALSPTGLLAACRAVSDMGMNVKVTGFGLPSELEEYVGDGSVCPYFYLRNPIDTGRITAYVSVALHSSQISGAIDEGFIAGDLGDFSVTAAQDGGTEVIVGSPVKVDETNLGEWIEVF